MSLQSLSIGVSGLRSHQTRLDTVSNNIANSSTTAFKRQRAAFSEELGQAILGVGRTAGGSNINPSKVGRGVSVASIDRNFSQGSLNDTGIKTDLALNGDGFFVASPKSGAASDQRRLTRAGNFTFNQNGELVTANGLNVQGWEVGEDGTANTGELKNVQFDPNAQSAAKATTEAQVGGNLSADAEAGDTSEISSVVYDEQGKAHNVVINFENTSEDTWTFSVEDPDGVLQDANGGGPGDANGTITFKDDGSVDSISGMTNAYDPDGNGTNDGVSLDWTNDAVQGGKSLGISLRDITQFSGSTTSKFQGQNGNSSGELSGVQFTPEGKLQLNYTNGVQEEEYQLAIGDVNNPNGLEQQGENFFTTTGASGDLQLGRAGRDLQTSVVSGALESSNVDLAKEFSDLIKAQRSYQASSQIITTADEVLNQTVQLKR
ncbi:flagellar hook protein FlgE [Salinibacter ruber]|jgi:flagellar hook protein FlgE|uniref:Flagellar hook protein FlgE n=4 Tax=Salinibacter ruber TaxID=146919 RepID=Q2RZC6_SALRD|nr:flagellar hook protein FlgE [Salinibacter ruber]ABC44010.1 flagellar biosynthesis cell-distal portion of basal-body rod [Salinibacter ruber DSM 13855]MBB4061749.1 flagellar hook protein FlgE [Salinibacter ruber]MBB4068403.1 flagellar hook protein FlgE [Salinibacter ruber]MCS3823194.1 flagellar hook protein FlgE [Salinibacter ruber]MCS3855918.1 flagellar hook protein FlgE [Salinibacter ruber]